MISNDLAWSAWVAWGSMPPGELGLARGLGPCGVTSLHHSHPVAVESPKFTKGDLGPCPGGGFVSKHYTVSDGELVLYLWPVEEGGYNVTSPLDPALITQAESVEEAFVMARDV
jgi:hypothetical protein